MTAPASHHRCAGICAILRAFGVFVALFLVVWLTSQFLVGPSETFTPAAKSTSQLDTSKILATGLASVDQAVSMLTAVQLSVFIVVGFVLRETLTTAQRPTLEQIIAGAVFLGCAFASITLGYGARIQAIGVVDGAVDQTYAGFGAVETTVVRQALFVVVSAISAVYLVVVALFDTNRTEPTAATASPAIAAVPAPIVVPAGTATRDDLEAEKGSP